MLQRLFDSHAKHFTRKLSVDGSSTELPNEVADSVVKAIQNLTSGRTIDVELQLAGKALSP